MNIQIEILNPEVKTILDQLVKLKLIKINNKDDINVFSNLLKKIRANTSDEISIDEISKEVDTIRQKRFEKDQNAD